MSKDILFVCTGNTCRSPMAMAIFNATVGEERAASAGMSVPLAMEAAGNAKEAVKKYGATLEGHLSRQITMEDLQSYSRIITMTASHKAALRSVFDEEKIITLAEFAGETGDISDPFGGDMKVYEDTARMIYEYINKGIGKASCQLAAEEDIKEIEEIEKECFPDAWSISSIEREIQNKRVIILKENGRVIGYCIFMIAADEGEILRIAVQKDKRKKGTGKKILSKTIAVMKEHSCRSAFLEVRESNVGAIALYESLGFKREGIRKAYYRDNNEDAVLFKLELEEG